MEGKTAQITIYKSQILQITKYSQKQMKFDPHGLNFAGGVPVVKILESLLTSKMIGLEWGSGGSSIWLAKQVKKLFIIEHNKRWHKEIIKRLKQQRLIEKCDFRLILPEKSGSPEYYSQRHNKRQKPAYYRQYCLAEHVPDKLDFAIIDGRARNACMRVAKKKLAPSGGILVLDDAPRYDLSRIPKAWEEVPIQEVKIRCQCPRTMIWISRTKYGFSSDKISHVGIEKRKITQYKQENRF